MSNQLSLWLRVTIAHRKPWEIGQRSAVQVPWGNCVILAWSTDDSTGPRKKQIDMHTLLSISPCAGIHVWAESGEKHPVESQCSTYMPVHGSTYARAYSCPVNVAVGELVVLPFPCVTRHAQCLQCAVFVRNTLEISPAPRLDNGTSDPKHCLFCSTILALLEVLRLLYSARASQMFLLSSVRNNSSLFVARLWLGRAALRNRWQTTPNQAAGSDRAKMD